MNLEELEFSLRCGEELEIRIGNKTYFLQPDYTSSSNNKWGYDRIAIFDSTDDYENPKQVFIGTIEEVLDYPFASKYTFRENLNQVSFF